MKNIVVPKVNNLDKALHDEATVTHILSVGCIPDTTCEDTTSRTCEDCILKYGNGQEFITYLINNKYITKSKALQLMLEDTNKNRRRR